MARIGKYVVTAELGRGDACIVHSALDAVIGRPVAIKVVSREGAESSARVARLQREARAGGSLHHGNIVSVYEYGEDAGTAWLAMELVQGRSLREHLAGGYRAAGDAELVRELLEALDFAHANGVTHGRLSAGSVLVSESGAAKLIGFEGADDEAADLAAAARILKELLSEPPALLDEPQRSARALLEAVRAGSPRRIGGERLGALRRAMKSVPAPLDVPTRRLPAVLFVDDEERVLNALRALFQSMYEVHTASSGAAALELLKARRVLVVCSDQRMPRMTGVQLLREAKTLAPATVRLLLTGYSDFSAVIGSVNESEVFRYITKPWQQAELEAILAEAVDVAIALEAAEAGGAQYSRLDGHVVVVGQPALARSVRELSAFALTVQEALDEETVLEIVSREEVGVVIAELDARAEEPDALLHVLKKASPHTQLVAISGADDSDLVIRLINESRIHRYLGKPVNLTLLQQAVASGLQRHARLQAVPGLGRTESTTRRRPTDRLRMLFEKLKTLGGRFVSRGAGA
jgi:response regulator RpfG family c-di-GMP phosphodiesterase/predicted Ser/Thr protein kinase